MSITCRGCLWAAAVFCLTQAAIHATPLGDESPEVVLEAHTDNVYAYGIVLPLVPYYDQSALIWPAGSGLTISGLTDVQSVYFSDDLQTIVSYFNSTYSPATFDLSYTSNSVTFMTPLGFSWSDYRINPVLGTINIISNALPGLANYTIADQLNDPFTSQRTLIASEGTVGGPVLAATPEPTSAGLLALSGLGFFLAQSVRRNLTVRFVALSHCQAQFRTVRRTVHDPEVGNRCNTTDS